MFIKPLTNSKQLNLCSYCCWPRESSYYHI